MGKCRSRHQGAGPISLSRCRSMRKVQVQEPGGRSNFHIGCRSRHQGAGPIAHIEVQVHQGSCPIRVQVHGKLQVHGKVQVQTSQ
jgi:hypothetical protein